MKKEQENHDNKNIVPLGNDEIKSILKSQSETIFEDKNISNNSNFVKKSLIDIALDFKSKENLQEDAVTNNTTEEIKNFEENNDSNNEGSKSEQIEIDEINGGSKVEDITSDTLQLDKKTNNEKSDEEAEKACKDDQSETFIKDESLHDVQKYNEIDENESGDELKSTEIDKPDDETQQALESVRDAVSQSINKSEDEIAKSSEDNSGITNNFSEIINKDFEDFKNILSSLTTLAEEAIYEIFQNKILEISYELAGYQIDKMPEKYEKKIKSFLKNINCYRDKIKIEINDKDFEALSKIKNFNENEDKNFFISNKELSRGDIVLNCDGMRYSEKTNFNT